MEAGAGEIMPRLSVYFVRASLIYMLLGFTIGGLMLANKGVIISPMIWSLLPLHMEFAFVGWIIQLAMGVAFWILPRFSKGPPRGDERLSWLALLLVNAGIILVTLDVAPDPQGFALAGRIFEIFGLLTFTLGNWKRIKPIDI
jgi:hypothetical protein